MDNVKRKLSSYRALKTISYLLGFPLLTVMVFATSLSFIGEKVYGAGAWYGVLVIVGLWLVVTILQIVFSKFSNYKSKTLLVLIISVVLVLVGAIVIDAVGTKIIKDTQEEYSERDVEIEGYTYQVNWFSTITSGKKSMNEKFVANVNNFIRTYNIKFESKNFGDENTDLSEVVYNKEDDAYYSPNGMYSDGFIFNIHQALDILITYHETQAYYKNDGKNADEELDAALLALESNSSSAWNQYKQTAQYKAAYGENGQAYKYMLTEERLDLILGTLGAELSEYKTALEFILNRIDGAEDFVELLEYLNEDLTVEQIVGIVNGLGLFEDPIEKEDLLDLLKGFSFYQSPQAKPIYDFIEDDGLREYGFAKYYATIHGAKVGSILIGDNIGGVTMDTPGYPASYGYSLDELYQLKADLSYKPTLYPLMAARRYMYLLAVIIGLSCIVTYYFSNKEKELFDTLTVGGK